MINIDLLNSLSINGDALQTFAAVWGAMLSTILATSQILKRRIRLDTTYSFVGHPDIADTITLVNLGDEALLVSYWTLTWEPTLFNWKAKTIEVTPLYGERGGFTVKPRDRFTLEFSEQDKIPWGWKVAQGRQLYLTLHIFGRKRSKRLKIAGGQ